MRELQQAVERLSQENQLLRQGQAGIAALAENLGRLSTSLQRGDRKLLIDTKGIGRPEVFSNDDGHFRRWARSVVNLTTAIFGSSFQSILEWVVDQDEEITVEKVEEEHGGELGMAGLDDKGDQLFRLLSSLTTHESEDLVINAKNGYEAWRRLNRRWDPLTAGRKRNILRAILNPERVKSWEAVRPGMEQLDDLMRRYEARRNERGEREVLSQDIKCTSLELLVPTDIERHLILNKNRLGTYEEMKQEIEVLIETVAGAKGKVHRPGSSGASGSGQGPAPMDVGAFTKVLNSLVKGSKGQKGGKGKGKDKGGGKGKGKGNGKDSKGKGKGSGSGSSGPAGACFNCGKTGHRAAECWSKKKDGKGSKGSGKSGSKQKHVAGFEDADYEAGDQEEQPEAEVGMFELGAFTQGESPKDPSWVRFNLDTGAAQTAIPVDWKDRIPTKEGAQMMFKTASGELVPGTGTGTFQGKSETGSRCRVTGPLAPVHKPLVSAYKCLKHGRMAVLDQDGGQLIPVDSATGRKIQQLLNKPSKAQKNTWLPIYQEKGVYNFYLKSEDCSGFGRQSNET